ncbi:hypothetical protein MSI_07010 [Treponema sp. JC4]|uniref:hypothetical protein n=1 Tax=Treponema sp. JC4 TaxID=1124982 RepID=UPI00025B04C2|nr:hypothetical protein [Treponema sp. JC4]EID86350.1 hypothetical protein MSI_07010 [Treponema sp. JC4]
MKKFCTVFFSLFFSLFLLLGCSNGLNEEQPGTSLRSLKIIATSNNLISFSSSSERSILPSAVDASSLHYYYWGKNKSDNNIVPVTEVTLYSYSQDSHKGFVDVVLTAGTYELYLFAVESDSLAIGGTTATYGADVTAVKNAAYYVSSATVDVRYVESVTFYLTPASDYTNDITSVTGYGNVNIELYTTWTLPDSGLTVIVGLYDLTTNKTIEYWNPDMSRSESTEWNLVDNFERAAPSGTPNYKLKYIKPDTYNFVVKFYTDGGKNCYVWSDLLTVFSNQNTNATIAIPPIIDALPDAAPSNFRAGWANPSNCEDDFYYTEFAWDDNSTNESYFQLELMDISKIDFDDATYYSHITNIMDSSVALSTKNTSWAALKTAGASVFECTPENYGDSDNVVFQHINGDGALWSNNTSIVYSFSLGKRYLARLCAMTTRGSSDYTYLDLGNGGTLPDSSKLSLSFNRFDSSASSLNLYKITYNYNGGRYTCADDAQADSKISRYVYNSQLLTGAAQPKIIYPLNYNYDGSHIANLIHPTYSYWQSWKKGSLDGDTVIFDANNVCEYTDCKNLSLFANYVNGTGSETSFDLNSNLFVFGGNATDGAHGTPVQQITIGTTNSNKDVLTVNRSNYPHLFFGVADNTSSPVYNAAASSIEAVKRYGITDNISGYNYNINIQYCVMFELDISNPVEFAAGNCYYVTLNLIKNENPNNPVSYTLKFYIEE